MSVASHTPQMLPGSSQPRPGSATPLGQRKRCPTCERLRQTGGAILLAAVRPGGKRKGKGQARATPAAGQGGGGRATGRAGLGRLWVMGLLAVLGLQLYFGLRVLMLVFVAPESTAFERTELWRLAIGDKPAQWQQHWVPYAQMSDHLKRAVVAAEDARFTEHAGVEWDAIGKAWQRNARALEEAARRAQAAENTPQGKAPAGKTQAGKSQAVPMLGGSTITQQLAKNLWLSGERNYLRKAQELVLAKALEAALSKRRILEIYLNTAEWGEGVFGAEAAARHHFNKPASALTPSEAARLAVMLPRPKYFEQNPQSAYLQRQSRRIAARMQLVSPP